MIEKRKNGKLKGRPVHGIGISIHPSIDDGAIHLVLKLRTPQHNNKSADLNQSLKIKP